MQSTNSEYGSSYLAVCHVTSLTYNNWFPANGLLKINGHSKCMASTVKLGNWFVIIHQPETIITYITDTAGLFLSSTYTYTTQTFLGPFQCTQSFAPKKTPTMPHQIHFLTRKRCHVFARNWWAVLSTATTKNTTQWRKKLTLVLCYTAMVSINAIATYEQTSSLIISHSIDISVSIFIWSHVH